VSRELLLDHLHSSGRDCAGPMCSLVIDRLNEEAERVVRNAPAPTWAKFSRSGPAAFYEPPTTWDRVAEVVVNAFRFGQAGHPAERSGPKAPGRGAGAVLSAQTDAWMTQLLAQELQNEVDPWENVDAQMQAIQKEIADDLFQVLVDEFASELIMMDKL
jgi:hypothetical protein